MKPRRKERQSFLIRNDLLLEVELMSDAMAGVLFKKILHYANTKEEPGQDVDVAVRMCFSRFKQSDLENAEHYRDVCEKNARNRAKWEQKRKAERNATTDNDRCTSLPVVTDKDLDYISRSLYRETSPTGGVSPVYDEVDTVQAFQAFEDSYPVPFRKPTSTQQAFEDIVKNGISPTALIQASKKYAGTDTDGTYRLDAYDFLRDGVYKRYMDK